MDMNRRIDTWRRVLWVVLAGWLFAGLAGCAQMLGPQSLHYSVDELNQMLARRFPLDRRMLEVLDVHVSQPVLSLVPERNHLATEFRLEATDRLFAQRYTGRIALESGLRYEASDHTLRLTDVRVLSFALGDSAQMQRPQVQRLGAALAEVALQDLVLQRVDDEQLARFARFGYQPSAAQVGLHGVDITLVPIKR
jgi:hypothetical protein